MVDVQIVFHNWLQNTGSPTKPVHEACAIAGSPSRGRTTHKNTSNANEEDPNEVEDRVTKKKNIPQLQVLVEHDPHQPPHSSSSPSAAEAHTTNADIAPSSPIAAPSSPVIAALQSRRQSKRPRVESEEEQEQGEEALDKHLNRASSPPSHQSEHQYLVQFMEKFNKVWTLCPTIHVIHYAIICKFSVIMLTG